MSVFENVRTSVKIAFHILQILIVLSGVFALTVVYTLFTRSDSLIPVPTKLMFQLLIVSVLSVVGGYLGLNCLNSERKTKIFLFIVTLCALMNSQILLVIGANRMMDRRVVWMNERWNSLTIAQRMYVQEKFKCCGLETVTDRVASKCSYDVPCGRAFEEIFKTLRNIAQNTLIYMFFAETVSLSMLGFLKFIKI